MHFSDVDECITDSVNCAQNCDNTVGSFACSCDEGYTTTDNGLTCDGIFSPHFEMILKIILHSTINLHLIININNSRFYSNSFLFNTLMMDIEQVNMQYSILQMWMNVQLAFTIVHRIVTTLLDPIPVPAMQDILLQMME